MAARRDNVIRITLRQTMNADSFNQIRYFPIRWLSNCPYEAGWTPFNTESTIKIVELLRIEPATTWLKVRHADLSAKEAVTLLLLLLILLLLQRIITLLLLLLLLFRIHHYKKL